MTETSLIAWGWMTSAMILASLAGFSVSQWVPWSDTARQAGVAYAFGFACGPFLLGLLSVLALALLPGASHGIHLAAAASGLIGLALIRQPRIGRIESHRGDTPPSGGSWRRVFGALLFAWVAVPIIDALFLPLTQNDALEYATVGRLLYELRDLAAYPALDPSAGSSGFFGPWTHPPLYPALIYFAYALQGHDAAPGLLRVIAPWYLLAAAGLVFALGRMASAVTGLIAGSIFVSAPLLVLGAGSALIDPLPVLAMAMLLCVVLTVEGTPTSRGIVHGLTLGAALWTHSQAVLLVPLTVTAVLVRHGLHFPRELARQAAFMLGVAALAAAWPYWRNLLVFGSFISDNPAVFALEKLNWPEYFRMQRGLDSWPDKIQYGIFKGWFALDAYGLAFWFMVAGLALAWRDSRCTVGGCIDRLGGLPAGWASVLLGIVLCYLLGVTLSTFFGIDLMIRNERYLLILMPCVALLASAGVVPLLGSRADRFNLIGLSTMAVLAVALLAQLLAVGSHRWKSLDLSVRELDLPQKEKLRRWSAYGAVAYLHERTPAGSTILSLKPADMYYADRRMVSYLDPRLLRFYSEENPSAAARCLRDLGISYLHVPDYWLPPIYRSSLRTIMAREDLSTLVYSANGHQIYVLQAAQGVIAGQAINLSPGVVAWVQHQQIAGGRKALYRLPQSQREIGQGEISRPEVTVPVFLRDRATLLLSRPVEVGAANDAPHLPAAGEYRLEVDLEGRAYARVFLTQYDATGQPVRLSGSAGEPTLIGDFVLGSGSTADRFQRRVLIHEQTKSIRVGVEHRGDTEISLNQVAVVPLARGGE